MKIPFMDYIKKKRGIQVYVIEAKPPKNPIELNIANLVEIIGWNPIGDRFRFFFSDTRLSELLKEAGLEFLELGPRLFVRILDKDRGSCLGLSIAFDGIIEGWSNDDSFAEEVFSTIFFDNPAHSSKIEDWRITREYSTKKVTIAFFRGILESGLGWKGETLDAIIREDLKEAEEAFKIGHWKSCIVMSARTVEKLIKDVFNAVVAPFTQGTNQKPTLGMIVGILEQQRTLPSHVLRYLRGLTELRNTIHPGGHEPTHADALLALSSAQSITGWIWESQGKSIGEIYTLEIPLRRRKKVKRKT